MKIVVNLDTTGRCAVLCDSIIIHVCIFTENFIPLFLDIKPILTILPKKYVTPFKRLNGISRFLVMYVTNSLGDYYQKNLTSIPLILGNIVFLSKEIKRVFDKVLK